MFTIITENDESKWDDEMGARYHFPNRYLKYLKPGTSVIYYKGKMKDRSYREKRLSDNPHYFGTARIGSVFTDKENSKNSYAEIESFDLFDEAINFKKPDGSFYELVTHTNHWRNGVRPITEEIYKNICRVASRDIDEIDREAIEQIQKKEPVISQDNLLIPKLEEPRKREATPPSESYSRTIKEVGELGESIVLNYLKSILTEKEKSTLRWLANEGETPGYDIEYVNSDGVKVCIEVKATTAKKFPFFHITINELIAAQNIREYYLYLVSECRSANPKIDIKKDPFSEENIEQYRLEPIAYKIYRKPGDTI